MPIKAILFDFMGTCLDWHSSILSALPQSIPYSLRSSFALDWRQHYFDINAARVQASEPPEDFDVTLHKALDVTLQSPKYVDFKQVESFDKEALVKAFHSQKAWDDVLPALRGLKEKRYELFVHANGTTRLQLDLVKSAGLEGVFDMLFSSELLGTIKPAREAYVKAVGLIRYKPEECVMVAAHAYDTRGAKEVGLKTVYVYRWTDDFLEEQEVVEREHDAYSREGMGDLVEVIDRFDK